jgi:hypothetical protein
MTPEPDALDFVNLPDNVTNEFVDSVEVNGQEFPLKEFTQAERHLWLKVRDESNLTGIIKEFGDLRRGLEELTGGTLVQKKEARIEKLNAEIDALIDNTAFDKWTDDHEKKLTSMITALDAAKKDLYALQAPLEDRALEESANMQRRLENLREEQHLIHLRFVWLLAKMRYAEKRDWDEYLGDAKGSDRQNAGEVVNTGNFTWETQMSGRAANRAMRRATRNN